MSSEDQMKVTQALADIHEKYQRLDPSEVVNEARPVDHVLHSHFLWDDRIAGERYRLDQARTLIQRFHFATVEGSSGGGTITIAPLYVRDPTAGPHEQGYVLLTSVIGDHENSLKVFEREVERINYCLARARGIAAVLGLEKQFSLVSQRCSLGLGKMLEAAREKVTHAS
jgi:hypothetical protein